MQIGLNYKNKKFKLNVKVCNWARRITGLMFTRKEKAEALLFDFGKPVSWGFHSFFVFFPFVAIWLDDKDKILDIKVVKPFKRNLSPKRFFTKVIEIPMNKRYGKFVSSFCAVLLPTSLGDEYSKFALRELARR
ncbi:MAG: DUF192 domain-containing protein [Nanoarchaeota archaeon]|nr:DUF192 domain-containing protein [Nanoarchaeota archaeon]MCG2700507.1 DUF192 domain-containing protein [Candidatus Parcubacteria bacterium]